MSNPDADTLPTLETIAELIKGFQQDVNTRFDRLEAKVDRLENGLEEVRLQMLSLETRHDRLASQVHELGAYVYTHNADLRVLTAEVRAWAKEMIGVKQGLGRL